ncbi:MAG: RNA polymerase sigma factor SigZ [Chloroflexi bacterium]|nr:RNA polymerase sigma factor SigZ [Chloroflexota bacterium]
MLRDSRARAVRLPLSKSDQEPAIDRNGDTQEELLAIWRELHDRLRAFIVTRVANQADADDILQEVFLRIHRHLNSLERADHLHAWVYQITRNAIIDHYRAPSVRREVPVGGPADFDAIEKSTATLSTEADSPELRELSVCLRPMIERLPSIYRQAIQLTEIEGVRQNVAAAQLSVSVSGMKSRVQRARRQLKEMMLRCCHIELDRQGGIIDYDLLPGQSCNRCLPPA